MNNFYFPSIVETAYQPSQINCFYFRTRSRASSLVRKCNLFVQSFRVLLFWESVVSDVEYTNLIEDTPDARLFAERKGSKGMRGRDKDAVVISRGSESFVGG